MDKERKLIEKFVREKEGEIVDLDVFFEWVDEEKKNLKAEDLLAWVKGFLSRLIKKKEKWEEKLNE